VVLNFATLMQTLFIMRPSLLHIHWPVPSTWAISRGTHKPTQPPTIPIQAIKKSFIGQSNDSIASLVWHGWTHQAGKSVIGWGYMEVRSQQDAATTRDLPQERVLPRELYYEVRLCDLQARDIERRSLSRLPSRPPAGHVV
jgi:hypothetical protein